MLAAAIPRRTGMRRSITMPPAIPSYSPLSREKVGAGVIRISCSWNHNGRNSLAFLFDLDGTLVDSVYQHVLAWREAFQAEGIDLAVWRIHRQIGMSGGLML